jgi:translocation and assembly module TamB
MKKKILYIIAAILILSAIVYASRSPYVSSALKKLILPELELATGKKFTAGKIYINLIPLFVEIKDLKAFDPEDGQFLKANRVKGYIGLFGFFNKEVIVRRLVIKGLEVDSTKDRIEDIARQIKQYLAQERKTPLKVVVKAVEVRDSTANYMQKDIIIAGKNINGEVLLSDSSNIRLSIGNIKLGGEKMPALSVSVDTYITLERERLDIKTFKMRSYGSGVNVSGQANIDGKGGHLDTDVEIFVHSVKKMFGLNQRGDGVVTASGKIKIENIRSGLSGVILDKVRVKGELYIETLMELLKVKDRIEGFVNIEGEISGPLNKIDAKAKTRLRSGNLFGVDVDSLKCNVAYKDKVMRFTDGEGSIYNGRAKAEAEITLPVVHHYTVNITADNVDSKGLFKLIRWDPGIPAGKVKGNLYTSGDEFAPTGAFHYASSPKGGDILDKVKEINGVFSMARDVISFKSLEISTGKSWLSTSGEVDLNKSTLKFLGNGNTKEMREFSAPYFTALNGVGDFKAVVSGRLEDPVIDMKLSSTSASFETGKLGISNILKDRTINASVFEGDVLYRKNLLTVKKLQVFSSDEQYSASGTVEFKKAKMIFDVREPDYDLNISVRNIDAETLSGTFQDSPHFTGRLNSDFRFYGKPADLRAQGAVKAVNLSLNRVYSADSADGHVSYSNKEFYFKKMRFLRGKSFLSGDGRLSIHKQFSFNAEGSNIKLYDVLPDKLKIKNSKFPLLQTVVLEGMRLKGEGSLDDPNVEIISGLYGGDYKGMSIGKGHIEGMIRNGKAEGYLSFLDGKLKIQGKADLKDKMSWSAKINMQPARYDFLLSGFLKDVPDDLLLNLSGDIIAKGDSDTVSADININRAHLYLYGIGLASNGQIKAHLKDKKFSIISFSMKSEASEVKLSGDAIVGESYDLILEGASSVAPLKSISKTIDVLRGDASFVFSVSGKWDRPKISGGLELNNGSLSFKNIHYRLSSLSAYIYIDEDRVVIEKSSGRLSGGNVSITGTAFLNGFTLNKFYIESKLHDITASASKDLWINFDGSLYYRGNLESQNILGDISIKRAKYTERIEWKSWLLRSRQHEKPKVEISKLDSTGLNVKIVGNNLTVDNNAVRAAMNADFLLRGTIGQPIILGKLNTKEGMVYFRNNEFRLTKASLDFSNPNQINPYFDIVADTRVNNYKVMLSLNGFVDQFNLSLSSDPVLNETDILSLLTVGQSGKTLRGLEAGIGAGEATSFLTGKMQDVVEDRLKTITGFDRVQVDPYVSKTTGTVSPRITVAKRLLGDKLYATYSTSVNTGEEQIWKIEYILNRNMSLIGLRDERGGLGGDIKFRFEFK